MDPTLRFEQRKAECLTYVKNILSDKELQENPGLHTQGGIPRRLNEKYGNCYDRSMICPNNGTADECDPNER